MVGHHNIEKSAFRPGQYVGYSPRCTWYISGRTGDWRATPHHGPALALNRTIYGATLADISRTLETCE